MLDQRTGMFYLSADDVKKFTDPFGRAVRSLAGVEDEDDLIARINRETDITDASSVTKAKKELARVYDSTKRSDALKKLSDRIKSQGEENKILGAANRLAYWKGVAEPNFIQNYAKDLPILNDYPKPIKTKADFISAMNVYAKNQNDKGGAARYISAFKEDLKEAKSTWNELNQYKTFDEIVTKGQGSTTPQGDLVMPDDKTTASSQPTTEKDKVKQQLGQARKELETATRENLTNKDVYESMVKQLEQRLLELEGISSNNKGLNYNPFQYINPIGS